MRLPPSKQAMEIYALAESGTKNVKSYRRALCTDRDTQVDSIDLLSF